MTRDTMDARMRAVEIVSFGGGLLLSERAAAERAAAKVWPLSERERAMQSALGGE